MKKILFLLMSLFVVVLLEACASGNSMRFTKDFFSGKPVIQIPIPEDVKFNIPIDVNEVWKYHVDYYSKEEKVFKVNLVLGEWERPNLLLTLRGLPMSEMKKDPSFAPPADGSNEAVVMYFLNWYAEYSFEKMEYLKGGSVISASYDQKEGFGVICLSGEGDYRECSAAKITDKDNLFVILSSTSNALDNPDKYAVDMMKSFDRY